MWWENLQLIYSQRCCQTSNDAKDEKRNAGIFIGEKKSPIHQNESNSSLFVTIYTINFNKDVRSYMCVPSLRLMLCIALFFDVLAMLGVTCSGAEYFSMLVVTQVYRVKGGIHKKASETRSWMYWAYNTNPWIVLIEYHNDSRHLSVPWA